MGNCLSQREPIILYRDGRFINTTNIQLTCSWCKQWLKKPVQSTNGHRFCETCIFQQREDSPCTRCEEDGIAVNENCSKLDMDRFFGDWQVVREMNEMKARCFECGFVGTCREIKKTHADKPCSEKTCCLLFTPLANRVRQLKCLVCCECI